MVSPNRYLAHHEHKSNEIAKILKPFGKLGFWGPAWGVWCRIQPQGTIGCIECPEHRFCQITPPPLKRNIDIEAELKRGEPPRDWGLMALYQGWRSRSLSHPELHRIKIRGGEDVLYDLPPELDELLGWGRKYREEIREREGW